MIPVAILISDNLIPDRHNSREDIFELDEQMQKLGPAFADQGMQLDQVRWRDAATKASDYQAMLPLFVWDYFEGNEVAFMETMREVSNKTRLLNSYDVLNWNSDKSYLNDLQKKGAPIIETITLDRVTQPDIQSAFMQLDTDKLVIKPIVGGGAWRQVLLHENDPFPNAEDLPPEGALVQPFLPSVTEEGEYSFLYFDGAFSHAVLKIPKSGDYRIQSIYGGAEQTYHPSTSEKEVAQQILNTLDFVPLYARVDLLRGTDGQLRLIELELIEPYLYLPHASGEGRNNKGARLLAKALKKRLSASS